MISSSLPSFAECENQANNLTETAPLAGITLISGENGSGIPGYALE
jgi:hypothetical protein